MLWLAVLIFTLLYGLNVCLLFVIVEYYLVILVSCFSLVGWLWLIFVVCMMFVVLCFYVLVVGEVVICFIQLLGWVSLYVFECLILVLLFGFWLSLFDYVFGWYGIGFCCVVVCCIFHLFVVCCWAVALLFAFVFLIAECWLRYDTVVFTVLFFYFWCWFDVGLRWVFGFVGVRMFAIIYLIDLRWGFFLFAVVGRFVVYWLLCLMILFVMHLFLVLVWFLLSLTSCFGCCYDSLFVVLGVFFVLLWLIVCSI